MRDMVCASDPPEFGGQWGQNLVRKKAGLRSPRFRAGCGDCTTVTLSWTGTGLSALTTSRGDHARQPDWYPTLDGSGHFALHLDAV